MMMMMMLMMMLGSRHRDVDREAGTLLFIQ